MIRLLRHDGTVHREDYGAVRFDDLAELFESRFAGTSQWSIEAWITFLAKGGGPKKRSQYCLNPNSSKHFLYSGSTLIDPTLQDNALLPNGFAEYIYHVRNAHDMHSTIQGGLIPGGRSLKRDRQSVFFTAVNPTYAVKIWKKFNTIWTNPGSRCTKILGEFNKIQEIGEIGSSLK